MNSEADKLVNEILNLSRNKLLVNLRFMDIALSYHKRLAYEGTIATNGKTLFYNPGFILRTYKESQEEMRPAGCNDSSAVRNRKRFSGTGGRREKRIYADLTG